MCYGRVRRPGLHRTTVVVGTVAEEAVASLRTSGTLDLGDPEVCHSLVGQVARWTGRTGTAWRTMACSRMWWQGMEARRRNA